MNELSLFSGAGGGLLGTKLLGWTTVGYVENNEYCQKIIKQRIEDGILDRAPIFGDIKTFISEGYAESYKGMVDVVTAGFPCQPFSVAGKQAGKDDPRNMWPQTIESIRLVRPQFALLENVPGLLAHRYMGTIFGDLAEAGYNARWCVLGAGDCGAPHRRKRLWILAYTKRLREQQSKGSKQDKRGRIGNGSQDVEKSSKHRLEKQRQQGISGRQTNPITNTSWWTTEPELGRVAHGVANRVHRLKAIGNGQVPIVVSTVWRLLTSKDVYE